jgi:hypothetical protein
METAFFLFVSFLRARESKDGCMYVCMISDRLIGQK